MGGSSGPKTTSDGVAVETELLLTVPFSQDNALQTRPLTFPAAIYVNNGSITSIIRPAEDREAYMKLELDVSRLNRNHHQLWLAGLPQPARSLHRQELIGRKIVVTEQADLHLVWFKKRIFIKPIPSFLLHYDSWVELGHSHDLHREACGLLYSYTWLISRNSDLKIAHDVGLLPKDVTWEKWTAFVADFLRHLETGYPGNINRRYTYGELRLARLNLIIRVRSIRHCSPKAFRSAFFQVPDWFSRYLRENFGWLFVGFACMSIFLNSLQVGLETNRLSQSERYQDASYGFSVFAVIMPVLMIGLAALSSLVVTIYNVSATLSYVRWVEAGLTRLEKASGSQV
jgi:hypothetical protein